jgi:hypothetical protein
MTRMPALLALAALSASTSAFAGSADAEVRCVSASGKTRVYLGLQDEMSVNQAKLAIDGKAMIITQFDANWNAIPGVSESVVVDYSVGVFTVTARAEKSSRFFSFYAVPSSMKKLKRSGPPFWGDLGVIASKAALPLTRGCCLFPSAA